MEETRQSPIIVLRYEQSQYATFADFTGCGGKKCRNDGKGSARSYHHSCVCVGRVLSSGHSLHCKAVNSSWKFSLPKKKKGTDKKPTSEEAAAIALALDRELNGEVHAAITLALHQYLSDTVHDMESYIITIKRKKS